MCLFGIKGLHGMFPFLCLRNESKIEILLEGKLVENCFNCHLEQPF